MQFVDFFLHLDHHINTIIEHYGTWTYLIVFLIVFCETGLVFTPFLPGDSLLFVLGAFAATGSLDLYTLIGLLTLAAISGDNLNYAIGKFLAPKIFQQKRIHFLKQEYLDRTRLFYEKHGPKAVIIGRFFPIIRTFSPFFAGIGAMRYRKFLLFDIAGGILWVWGFTLAGYFFGNLPVVKKNFTLVVFAIIFISLLPGIIEYLKHRKK